jgi:hypothetical protein
MTNETAIVSVKLLRTAILFVSLCILYVLVCAVTGRTSPKLMNAAAIHPNGRLHSMGSQRSRMPIGERGLSPFGCRPLCP